MYTSRVRVLGGLCTALAAVIGAAALVSALALVFCTSLAGAHTAALSLAVWRARAGWPTLAVFYWGGREREKE